MPNEDKLNKPKIEPIDAQQLNEDEAFIDELYQTLDQQNNVEQSPSEMLDKRIISAANTAVSHCNIDNNNNSNNHNPRHSDKIDKQPTTGPWNTRFLTTGLATAASLTLVISLVVQQQEDIFSPLETQPTTRTTQKVEPQHYASRKSSAEALSMDLTKTTKVGANEPLTGRLTAQSPTNKISRYEAADRERARKDSRESQRDNRRQVSRQISPLPESMHGEMNQPAFSNEAMVMQSPRSVDESLVDKRLDDERLASKWLSKNQFIEYLAQNNSRQMHEKIQWSLLSIEQSYYQIVVYLTSNITREHRLSKQDFVLAQAILTSAENKQYNGKFRLSDISLKQTPK
jgi:hypothetical protein